MKITRNELEKVVESSNNFNVCGASGIGYEWSQLQLESVINEDVVIIIDNYSDEDGLFSINIEDYSNDDDMIDSFEIESVEELVDFILNY